MQARNFIGVQDVVYPRSVNRFISFKKAIYGKMLAMRTISRVSDLVYVIFATGVSGYSFRLTINAPVISRRNFKRSEQHRVSIAAVFCNFAFSGYNLFAISSFTRSITFRFFATI